MRIRPEMVLSLSLLAALGCGRPSQDSSRVLANVGGTKITEAELGQLVRALIKNPAQAEAFLNEPNKQTERLDLVKQMAESKAVLVMAQGEGLDRDALVQARVEAAMAKVYFETLLERRVGEPTDAVLKAEYDLIAGQAKAQGDPSVLPFEQVKDKLAARWQQQQMQARAGELQKEIHQKVPMTFVGAQAGK